MHIMLRRDSVDIHHILHLHVVTELPRSELKASLTIILFSTEAKGLSTYSTIGIEFRLHGRPVIWS
jgi:hypothetical protein